MKALNRLSLNIAAILLMGNSFSTFAEQSTSISDALKNSSTDINFRYRLEQVDQDGLDKNATASTLKTRLTWQTAKSSSFFSKIEIDNVLLIGNDNYNSTNNGKAQYPVVADPDGTDINQAYIGYKTDETSFTLGRQRINHNDQRFVGGVGWRQNEQTYDGVRIEHKTAGNWHLDYSFIYNINRIFGPDHPADDLQGNFHLANVKYAITPEQSLKLYAYHLDFDDALALSSSTYGIAYDAKYKSINLHAAAATQRDTGDNPSDYSTHYYNLEVNGNLSQVNLGVGYESLGSDNNVAFSTPLATLHKFQGFADKFLGTPAGGVDDLYFKIGTKLGGWNLTAIWHDFSANEGSADYGTELDLVAKYKLTEKAGLLLKYADYNADDLATDTQKFWGMLTYKL